VLILKERFHDSESSSRKISLIYMVLSTCTSHVVGSNYYFMNVYEDRIPRRAIIMSVISTFT
jgi:N-acetyl-gamma-glutamyl-phosphate reductase